MFVCQWHFDIPYGKQTEVVRLMKNWLDEGRKTSNFKKSHRSRILVGHIGKSPSHVTVEHEFETMNDFEAALADMRDQQFKTHSDNLAPYIIAGTQHWEILRIAE